MAKQKADIHERRAIEAEIAKLTTGMSVHQKDLLLPCPAKRCRAAAGTECVALDTGIVHFGRRLQRLLKDIR